jgi:ArsR family transcriptional regulator, arsenate/arsenite/antimonite-responsive transcriptional repressor / arsenate reductase (thioredoxin)
MELARADRPEFVRLAAHPLRWRLLTELADSDLRVRELVELAGEPQNLVSYHLRLLRDAGLVGARRSSFDGRDSYYHLDLERCAAALSEVGSALHPALRWKPQRSGPEEVSPELGVAFVCTGNSARSPMAEALLRHRTGGRISVSCGGTRPKAAIHPHAVRVLRDDFGIDIAGQPTRHVDTLVGGRFDYLISLCDKAREACPEFARHPRRLHWSLADPATAGDSPDTSYAAFRAAATDIDTRVRHLLPVLTAASS